MNKIIAVAGASRSGKTYLVKKLAETLGYIPFIEGENDIFPEFITEDIKNITNSIRRIVWFRNKQIEHFLSAQKLRDSGKSVLLDTFWIDSQMYNDVLLEGDDRDTIRDMALIDLKLLPWPDVVVYLKNDAAGMKKFLEQGGRDFDQSIFENTLIPLQENYEKTLKSDLVPAYVKYIEVDRSKLDFDRKEDLQVLVDKILS